GSDITGALVARAVNADVYENWTDVSGFLMADPRIVKNPRSVPVISYREQRELSHMGASVLHEDAVMPARLAGIPINIRNTDAPDDEGTMIVAEDSPDVSVAGVRGIAGKRGYTALRIYKNAAGGGARLLTPFLAAAARRGIAPDFAMSAVDAATLFFAAETNPVSLDAAVREGSAEICPEEVVVDTGITLIGVIGRGVGAGAASKIADALTKSGIEPCGACFCVGDTSIIVGVENEDYETALKAVYAKFA
ncbi:MAG: aspartate kinase, partial [Clostridiales Family XIII bacterium]|nr:aspartate kinase [Clostridiales Family XIII bacterium]